MSMCLGILATGIHRYIDYLEEVYAGNCNLAHEVEAAT